MKVIMFPEEILSEQRGQKKEAKKLLTLPFVGLKVNLYNYTVLNKLKETRLIKSVKVKKRPVDNFKQKEV